MVHKKSHLIAQKSKKSVHETDDEEESGEVSDAGDYAKEVRDNNVDTFK